MQVSEGDVSNIKVGNKVEYSILSNNSKKYTAYISSIDPGLTTLSDGTYSTNSSSSSSAVYYYAKVNVDNSDEIYRNINENYLKPCLLYMYRESLSHRFHVKINAKR